MRKNLIRIAAAFLGFAALGITTKAQVADQAIVKVPYQFVVAGTTLPAGTYRLTRSSGFSDRQLLLSSTEERVGVFVLPIEVEDVQAIRACELRPDRTGDVFKLVLIDAHAQTLFPPALAPSAPP